MHFRSRLNSRAFFLRGCQPRPSFPGRLDQENTSAELVHSQRSTEDTYAGGTSATEVRSVLRRASLARWGAVTLDIKTAFLRAPRDHSREIVVVTPPQVFIMAGLCSPGTLWLVDRARRPAPRNGLAIATVRSRTFNGLKERLPGKLRRPMIRTSGGF